MNEARQVERKRYLVDWARGLERAAIRGVFGGQPIALRETILVNGPRAGALEIFAGLSSPAMLRAMTANDGAILRQFIPWPFTGAPSAFMAGRHVRLEAGWPSDMADANIRLSDMGSHPVGRGRWLVGRNERGNVLTAGLNDDTPHWLVSGTTGSGKTTELISAVGQFARDLDNRLILIDAKHGKDFRHLANVRGLVGPLADDVYTARAALTWACQEMTARYSGGRDTRRLVIVVDEMQELVDDSLATEALRRLIAQGRGARVHCLIATQHPTVDALGDRTIGKNLGGRLALRVIGAEASRVAVGAKSPRADYLLGHGDAYAVSPTATHRVQCAMFDGGLTVGELDLAEWPEDTAELPDNSNWPSGPEIGAAILSASRNEGRVKFVRSLQGAGLPGMSPERAVKVLGLARDVLDFMTKQGAFVRSDDDTHTDGAISADYTVR